MNISIIIPTYNGQKHIKELILSLKQQTILPIEIVIVDSTSTDLTVEYAQSSGCKVTFVDMKDFDHGGTRNLGSEIASGEIVVFMTQDAIPVNDKFLEELIKPLRNHQIAASFGRQVARPDAAPPERFARLFNYPETAVVKSRDSLRTLGIKTFFFSNVCSAIKKKEFKKVGRFPSRVVMNEDMLLAARLIQEGYKIAYVPEAAVWHSHNYGALQQFRRNFDIGASLSMNKWVLEMAGAESEGLRFVKEQFKYLFQAGHYLWITQAIGINAARLAGYKLGLIEEKLPLRLKKACSMHKNFWK
jgi:rhamnosyltransferase